MVVVKGRDMKQFEEAWYLWGLRGWAGPVLNSALSWIKFTVLLGLIKWIPPADEHGCGAPGLALLPEGSVFSRYCAALEHLLIKTSGSRCSSYIPSEKAWLLIWRKSLPEFIMWSALNCESVVGSGRVICELLEAGSFLFVIRHMTYLKTNSLTQLVVDVCI